MISYEEEMNMKNPALDALYKEYLNAFFLYAYTQHGYSRKTKHYELFTDILDIPEINEPREKYWTMMKLYE